MGVVFACIAPHGAEVIPELVGKELEAFGETRHAMESLANLMDEQKPETIIVATPHGLRLQFTIGVVTSEFTEGNLQANGRQVKLRCKCDRKLATEILRNARGSDLPVIGVNYGTDEGPSSCMPMDWGALIPLWFLARKGTSPREVVIATPSREIPLGSLVEFGQVIAETAKSSKKGVAFVASADQSHTHRSDGPYGFHPASKEFDETAIRAVLQGDLGPLLSLSKELVEDAKPDSIWQIAVLQGVLNRFPMKAELLSYQAPTYFGMLCAAFVPRELSTEAFCHYPVVF